MSGTGERPILTFGYGRRDREEALALVKEHRVEYVVDVRSVPWSRYQPEFSQPRLRLWLREAGIGYVFMGDELGGRPDDESCYDDDGHVDYIACRGRAEFKDGVERLTQAWNDGHRLAIMCSEGKPQQCHRTKLVASVLLERGVEVRHIDEEGRLRSQDEILDRLRANQMQLIPDASASEVRSRGRYISPA